MHRSCACFIAISAVLAPKYTFFEQRCQLAVRVELFSYSLKTRRSSPNEDVPIMTKLSWDKKNQNKICLPSCNNQNFKQRAAHALPGHKVHDQASLIEEHNVMGYRDISSSSVKSPETNFLAFWLILHSLMRPVNTPRTRSVYTLRAEYTRDGVRITDHDLD